MQNDKILQIYQETIFYLHKTCNTISQQPTSKTADRNCPNAIIPVKFGTSSKC